MVTKSIQSQADVQKQTLVVVKRQKASPFWYYFYCELMQILRDPWSVVFGILFPTVFFLIFGTSLYARYATTLLAQYAAYGAFVAAFQIFSIAIASERGKGWQKLMRTTPMSPLFYLGMKFLIVMCTGISSLLLLFVIAATVGKVHMQLLAWCELFGCMLAGMIPFALAGIFLGFAGRPSLSQVLGTVLTLVLSFASGFYVPLDYMPSVVRSIAPYLPTYHLTQLAWYAVNSNRGRDSMPIWMHVAILGGFALVFALLALWAYKRDAQQNYV